MQQMKWVKLLRNIKKQVFIWYACFQEQKTGTASSTFFLFWVSRDMYENLTNCQNGFVKGRQSVSNLSFSRLGAGVRLNSIYMDFFKTFYKVRNRLLLKKMSFYIVPSRYW
jgi:hypothetical protein